MPPLPDTHPARWDAAVRHAREVRERTDATKDRYKTLYITDMLRRFADGKRTIGLLRTLEKVR